MTEINAQFIIGCIVGLYNNAYIYSNTWVIEMKKVKENVTFVIRLNVHFNVD